MHESPSSRTFEFDPSYLYAEAHPEGHTDEGAPADNLLSLLQRRTSEALYTRKPPSDNSLLQQQGSHTSTQEAWDSCPCWTKHLFYTEYFTVDDRMLLLTSCQFLGAVLDLWLRRDPRLSYPMAAHEAVLQRNGAFFWCSVVESEVGARGYRALAPSKSARQYTERIYTFKRIKGGTRFGGGGGTSPDETPRVTREHLRAETIDDYLILHVLYVQEEAKGAAERLPQLNAAMAVLCPDPIDAAHTLQQCKEKSLWKLIDMRFQWCDLFDASDD